MGFCLDFGNNEKIQGKSDKKGHEFMLFLVYVENGKENRIRWKIEVILVWEQLLFELGYFFYFVLRKFVTFNI